MMEGRQLFWQNDKSLHYCYCVCFLPNIWREFPSRMRVLAAVNFLNGNEGIFFKLLWPKSKWLMFIPTKTLSSILMRELWLKSSRLSLVKWPKVPSLSLEIALEATLTSDNLGEVSKRWTPMVGKAFWDKSNVSSAGKPKADPATVWSPLLLKLRLFRLGNPLST